MASEAELNVGPPTGGEEGLSFEGAVELTKRGDIEEAIEAWATLLQNGIESEGETAPSIAPLYYRYGDALLRKAEESDDLFGGGGDEKEAEEEDKKEEEEEEAPSQEENEDALLAWEMLEVARKLYSEGDWRGGDSEGHATTLLRLGDLQKLNGNLAAAILDYDRCLKIRLRIFDVADRGVADVEWCLAVAFEYSAADKNCTDTKKLRAEALRHYRSCASSLEGVAAAFGLDNQEAKKSEIEEILDELRETIVACEARDAAEDKEAAEKKPTTSIGFYKFGDAGKPPAAAAVAVAATQLQPKKKKQKREQPLAEENPLN